MLEPEKWIEKQYMNSFVKQVNDMDRSGIHVTELTSDCLRKIWYGLRLKEMGIERELTTEQAYIFWIGKKYHEVQISNIAINDRGIYIIGNLNDVEIKFNRDDGMYYVYDKDGRKIGVYGHELPVQWYNVRGQIDEIIQYGNAIYITDKKTTSKIPPAPYPNYVKQVQYYAVMLKNQWGIDADYGAILFIQKPSPFGKYKNRMMLKTYTWKLENINEIENEFKNKVDNVMEYLHNNEMPSANQNNNDCRFCQWKDLCKNDDSKIKMVRQKTFDNVILNNRRG